MNLLDDIARSTAEKCREICDDAVQQEDYCVSVSAIEEMIPVIRRAILIAIEKHRQGVL